MEHSFTIQTKHFTSFVLYLYISSLLLSPPSEATTTTPPSSIQRITKQQILVTLPPDTQESTEPFLTSPSAKYTAYLLRRETAPTAGGFGNDFCYVQVQDTSSGQSVWESDCAPVSSNNACSLLFTDAGLEVYDGSQSVWDTGADGNHPNVLELVDEGDMRIIDKDGELVWKASDEPQANQGCGLPGSPGLAPVAPPFAAPIGGGGNLPFGQAPEGGQQQQQQQQANGLGLGQAQQMTLGGLNQPADGQPLVDNTPFDSRSARGVESFVGVGLALVPLFWFMI